MLELPRALISGTRLMEPRSRVAQVRRFGDPDALKIVDAPLPTAGPREVRVRVHTSGLEYIDVLIRRHD